MIDKPNAEHGPNSRKIARRPQIFRAGSRIAARMIMRNDHRRSIDSKPRGEDVAQRQVDESLLAFPCARRARLSISVQKENADMLATLVAKKRPKQLKRCFWIIERSPACRAYSAAVWLTGGIGREEIWHSALIVNTALFTFGEVSEMAQ